MSLIITAIWVIYILCFYNVTIFNWVSILYGAFYKGGFCNMYFFLPYNYSCRQPMSYDYLRQPYHVKCENINERTYRALNYQTNDAQQAGYVPNAQFPKVGATVHWDK